MKVYLVYGWVTDMDGWSCEKILYKAYLRREDAESSLEELTKDNGALGKRLIDDSFFNADVEELEVE